MLTAAITDLDDVGIGVEHGLLQGWLSRCVFGFSFLFTSSFLFTFVINIYLQLFVRSRRWVC